MAPLRRVKLTELNAHLVCVLCSGYFVDATTIIECLHTFCKTCIVRYLQTSSFCPICEVQVHKTKPLLSLREDRTLQDVVFKLVPGLFNAEMKRRQGFYTVHPEAGGDKTEQSLRERRHFFHVDDQISLSLEYMATAPSGHHLQHALPLLHHTVKPLKVNNSQQEKAIKPNGPEEKMVVDVKKEEDAEDREVNGVKVDHKRYLRCPAAVQVSHLEKFIRLKYSLTPQTHKVDIIYGGDCLVGELTLLDVVYMYKWTEDVPLRLMYTVTAMQQSRKRARLNGTRAQAPPDPDAPSAKVPKIQSTPSEEKPKAAVSSSPVKEQCKEPLKNLADVSLEDMVIDMPEESPEKTDPEPPAPVPSTSSVAVSKPPSSSGVMTSSTAAIQSLPNTSFTSVAIQSGVGQLSCPAAARGRPALTTTTPSTTTPRVALTAMPPTPVNPPSVSTTVPMPVSGPVTSDAITTSYNTQPSNVAVTSVSGMKMQVPQPMVNGVSDGGMKPSNFQPPQVNNMPRPIIPTKPRLGRPPNASRILASNMRPAPRIPDMRNTRPILAATKNMAPAGMMGRGNQLVSASLTMQGGNNIGKAGTQKLPIKRTNEVLRDTLQKTDANEGTKAPRCTNPAHKTSGAIQTTPGSSVTKTVNSTSSPLQSTIPLSQGLTNTVTQQSSQTGIKNTAAQQSTQPAQCPTDKQNNSHLQNKPHLQTINQADIHSSEELPSVAAKEVAPRPPGTSTQQQPSTTQNIQRASGTQTTQTTAGLPVNQRPTQASPHTQGNQQNSTGKHTVQQTQSPKVTQPSSCPHSRTTQIGNPAQRLMTPKNPTVGLNRLPASALQKTSPLTSRPPGSPAPHQPPLRPAGTPTQHRMPSSPAPHRAPGSPAPHRAPSTPAPNHPPASPAPHRAPSSPAPHRSSGSPSPHQSPSNPSPHQPSSTPTPHRPPGVAASHRPPGSPAPHRSPSTPVPSRPSTTPVPPRPSSNPVPPRPSSNPVPPRPSSSPSSVRPSISPALQRMPFSATSQRPPSSPAAYRQPSSPAPHRASTSPATHRQPSSPAPHRAPPSPAPHRAPPSPAPHRAPPSPAPHRAPPSPAPHRAPPSPAPHRAPPSPASHRQEGSATPRPQSTLSQNISSTPSPKVASPSVPSMTVTPIHKDPKPSPSATPPNPSTASVPNGRPGGLKPGASNIQGRAGPTNMNNTRTPPTKTPSPAASKAPPKSPNRGRTASNSPTILSIAHTLANKQLQHRTTIPSTTTFSTPTTTSISQLGTSQVGGESPGYNSNIASTLMQPAFAAAYMASAYGGDPSAITDTAMRNLITLSQTAACIREMNIAAIVKAAETLPRPPEPAPMDLSPTCKAPPQNVMTNGRLHTSTAGNTNTKTTSSHASKSPSKSRSLDNVSISTISSPTSEVTITKLPNVSMSIATTQSITGTAKTTAGFQKSGSTNTNTVSITKRPSTTNRFNVAKSPANASIRNIPNPSLLNRHHSEPRNNNNISKSVPSTSTSSSVVTNTMPKNQTSKHSGGKTTGNSPLKETGPLPETSSILKMEHLTRSLGAPAMAAAAAAASHGIRYFDHR